MDKLEQKTEEEILNHLSHIVPERSVFESTMTKFVTTNKVHRYNKEKASVLSFYQLINNFIMISKKNILVGVPLVMVAIIAVIFIAKSPNDINRIAINQTPVTEEQYRGLGNDLAKEDMSSIDSIVASFKNDADNEAIMATSESEDAATLTAELQDYNKIKTYEEIL